MATIKQIEANRLNAQKSTGPRSVEGKLRSSQNALKSGIDAESLIIHGEDRAALETLTQEYVDRFHPTAPEQRHFVDILIRDDWQLRRLAKVDAQLWEYELAFPLDRDQSAPHGRAYASGATTFSRIQRRIDSLERSYQRALRELQLIEVGRPFRLQPSFCSASNQDSSSPQVPDLPPPIGFVPQKSAEPSAERMPPTVLAPILSLASPSRDLDPNTPPPSPGIPK
jgi:hypothetical protein